MAECEFAVNCKKGTGFKQTKAWFHRPGLD